MKKLYALFIFTHILFISKAQIVNMQWAKSVGDNSSDVAKSVITDASGNVYTTGYFQGTVDFDPGPGTFTISSMGSNDIFVLKLNSVGNLVWAKSFGGTGNDNGLSIKVDATGNVYSTGFYSGTVDFNPGAPIVNLVSVGFEDVFVSKLDASGNFVWAKSMGGIDGDISDAIALDASGNIYTTGVFQGVTDFDPGVGTFTINGSLNGDIFISKLDASGAFVWAKSFSGSVGDFGKSITVDGLNNVYTSGYYSATVDFNPGGGVFNLTANGNQDVFISKLDALGNFVWAQSIGGVNNDYGNSITLDAFNNVYITGAFDGNVDFDPGPSTTTLSSNGGTDVFVSKLNSSGNFVWAKNFGSAGSDFGNGITIDANNNIYTTGSFVGICDFDPGIGTYTANCQGLTDIFISKLDDQGNFLWAKQMGGIGNEVSNSITVDVLNNVYTSGEFDGIVDFDPNVGVFNLTAVGAQDIFVHKMSQCFVPAAPVNITNINSQTICYGNSVNLIALSTATVLWYATPTSTIALGNGTNFVTPVLAPGTYSYYAEASSCTISLTRTIFTITVNTNPTVTAVSNMSFICSGESATLSASGADSYTWSSGGNSVSEIVSPSVTTSYTVTGFDVNNCATSVVVSQSVNACIGVKELAAINSHLKIYPNPSNGILNVELESLNINTSVQIINVMGQVLIEETVHEKNFALNISDLKSGIYFVEIKQKGVKNIIKVIKE